MRMVLHRFENLHAADTPVLGAVGAARALLRGVLEAQLDGVETELFGELIDHGLGSKSGVGRARSAVGGGARLVHYHVVTVDDHVGDVIAGEHAHRAGHDHGARIGARFVSQASLGRGDVAIFPRAHFHLKVGSRSRARAFEHVFA